MPERLRHHIERSRNNPYEWAFCSVLLVLSLYGLLLTPPSSSLDEGLNGLERVTYSLIGLIGGVFTIVGLRIRDAHLGLIVERVGQAAVSGGAAIYVFVLCMVSTFAESGIVTMMGIAIALGAFGRTIQITRDLNREKRFLTAALGIQEAVAELPGTHEGGSTP